MSFRRIRELRNYKKYITVWAMALTMAAASVPVSAAHQKRAAEQKIFRKI